MNKINATHNSDRNGPNIVERLRQDGLLPLVLRDLLGLPSVPKPGQSVRCAAAADTSRHKNGDRRPSMVIGRDCAGAECKGCGFGGGLLEITALVKALPSHAAAASFLEETYLAAPRVDRPATSSRPGEGEHAPPAGYRIPAGYWERVRQLWNTPEGHAMADAVGVPHAAVVAARGGLDPGDERRPPAIVFEVFGPDPERCVRARKFRYAPDRPRIKRDKATGHETLLKSDTWGAGTDTRSVGLLNLHRLSETREEPVEVWIVAGEKDMLNTQAQLDAHGVPVVVLGACGESLLLEEFRTTLAGCTVAVIYDADTAGRKGAAGRCAELRDSVRSIRDVLLPFTDTDRAEFQRRHPATKEGEEPKSPKDLTDWFELGHSLEELRGVVATAPVFEATTDDPADEVGADAPSEEPGWLNDHWKSVGDWGAATGGGWFITSPPERKYVLSVEHEGRMTGVLPAGKVGTLVAGGGRGKSWFLVLSAVSVATGIPLFGTFHVREPGHVLLALAEEDVAEVRRRLFHANWMLNLTDQQQRLVEERVVVLPLCGREVSLQRGAGAGRGGPVSFEELAETGFAKAVRRRLEKAGVAWRLLMFDPLSRFAGIDCETDNAAATRFVEICETFVRAPGAPAVLVAHHANKQSRTGDTNESAARGSSALTDGVRWQANLDTIANPSMPLRPIPGFVNFHVVKSNYALIPPDVLLIRDAQHDGALRLPSEDERKDLKEQLDPMEKADDGAPRRRGRKRSPLE